MDRCRTFPPPLIEDAGASTTILLGPTRTGPTAASIAADRAEPQVLGSWADFERLHGDCNDLRFHDTTCPNYLAHAARLYFDNGGTRLRVLRVTSSSASPSGAPLLADYEAALDALGCLDEPSLLAAPGYSALALGDAIQEALLARMTAADPPRLFLILDSPPHADAQRMRAIRARIESTYAAIYYPWVTSSDVTAGRHGPQLAEICVPPSAFVCGALARNDREHGMWRTPAHQELKGALGLEQPINHSDEEWLSSIGVNCLRSNAAEGTRIRGERTAGSDANWQYVNARRYGIHLESSISRGLEWTRGEPNDETLWSKVRGAVFDFLYAQWQYGAFAGSEPGEAFFVRCDGSTMTAADVVAGRLRCVIGIALTRPSDFTLIKIGKLVAGSRPATGA